MRRKSNCETTMDIQRVNPYVSCIKIRGVPIIAPLMTEDLRLEMKYYKHLAMAVEERLRNLQAIAESASHSPDTVAVGVIATEESSNCEAESESFEKSDKATATVIDIPINEVSIKEHFNRISDNPDSSPMETTGGTISLKSFSDEETSCRNDSCDIVTASTDINRYLNGSLKSDTVASTVENSYESRKPDVPKTLDIIPIIVDATIVKNIGTPPEKMKNFNEKSDESQSQTTPESDETPKLVRQGSYVLETPSPMLLAHLQEEITNYVPSNSAIKRREWNLSEAKSEWELHKKKDNFVVANSSRGGTSNRIRRNSASSANNQRRNRYSTQTRGGKYLASSSQQVARSADCIQSMLHKENNSRNLQSVNKINGQKENSNSNVNGITNCNNTKSISILNLANKLGGSLGSLSNGGICFGKRTPKKSVGNRLSKSFDSSENLGTTRSEGIRGSTQKLLSTVTSEKLVHVFQEIQSTHERQMTELIDRQRREQQIMQKEFEKQQFLLLAQIEQTFPEISLRRLVERVSPAPHSPVVSSEKTKRSVVSSTRIAAKSKSMEINGSDSPKNNENPKCPLDDIYPREEVGRSSAYPIKQSQSTCTYVIEQKSPPIGLYSTSVLNGERRNSGVSRQLFPLEGKTRHVPVPNRMMYQEQHVKAATIITAYARGYLVRRLLQTDRVIALKITYKEALHCMLKLHVDAPLALPELNFHQRLQLQCDAASMNIVELFAQDPAKRMEIIRQDRQIKRSRQERPNSARSYSFATQRTLARKKLKDATGIYCRMGDFQTPGSSRTSTLRSRCQTWASNAWEKRSPNLLNQGIKRSTSAGAVRKPWR